MAESNDFTLVGSSENNLAKAHETLERPSGDISGIFVSHISSKAWNLGSTRSSFFVDTGLYPPSSSLLFPSSSSSSFRSDAVVVAPLTPKVFTTVVDFTVRDFAARFLLLLLLLPKFGCVITLANRCKAVLALTLLNTSYCSSTRFKINPASVASIKSPCKSFARSNSLTLNAARILYSLGNANFEYDHFRLSKPNLSSLFACVSTQSNKTENLASANTNFASFLRNLPALVVKDTAILCNACTLLFGLNCSDLSSTTSNIDFASSNLDS